MNATGDAAATFCATIVDEWHRCGVNTAIVAPGSRSTPLAVALLRHPGIDVQIFHDERSASFAALGVGVALGVPAVLLCTSGTAAAQFHAAVVEAHQSAVPMIVCTADRPPELHGIGAPQTIDQVHLFGTAVRKFIEALVPSSEDSHTWRSLAREAFEQTTGLLPGPVHLNLAFREPLIGDVRDLPPHEHIEPHTHEASCDRQDVMQIVEAMSSRRGLIIAGKGATPGVGRLAKKLGWPIFADARSGLRSPQWPSVAAFDSILRVDDFVRTHRPDVVIRVGESPASKVLSQWVSAFEGEVLQICADIRMFDAERAVTRRFVADIEALTTAVAQDVVPTSDSLWLSGWLDAERLAQNALASKLSTEWSEPSIARMVSAERNGALVVSSSMPIRDTEWFGTPDDSNALYSNRGANGIDGVVSTAVGIALVSFDPTYLLIGDIAFIHDSNGLWNLAERNVDLRIVVVNNSGGSIFSFLPQAQALETQEFETILATPHSVDICSLARSFGIPAVQVHSLADLRRELDHSGPVVIEAVTDRSSNVAQHDDLNNAVARAINDL